MSLEQSNKKGSPSELNVISKGLKHFLSLLSFSKNSNRNENIILSSKLKVFEHSRTKVLSFLPYYIPPSESDIGKYLVKSELLCVYMHNFHWK